MTLVFELRGAEVEKVRETRKEDDMCGVRNVHDEMHVKQFETEDDVDETQKRQDCAECMM